MNAAQDKSAKAEKEAADVLEKDRKARGEYKLALEDLGSTNR